MAEGGKVLSRQGSADLAAKKNMFQVNEFLRGFFWDWGNTHKDYQIDLLEKRSKERCRVWKLKMSTPQ
jgi:hypothetical protein